MSVISLYIIIRMVYNIISNMNLEKNPKNIACFADYQFNFDIVESIWEVTHRL
jgi:hypothetical protein